MGPPPVSDHVSVIYPRGLDLSRHKRETLHVPRVEHSGVHQSVHAMGERNEASTAQQS